MNQSILNQSTALGNSTSQTQTQMSKLMNKTLLLSEHDNKMKDILTINFKEQQQNFKNEISMIQGSKDSIASGVYLSNIQKERSDQYDVVLAQRKYVWKQEEELYKQVEELRKTNKRYQDSVHHYGIKNHNLEIEVKQKFDAVQQKLHNIQDEKSQVLKNYELIQQSLVNTKSKLSNTGQFVVQGGNQQYDQLADFIRQQEKKVHAMKTDYNDPTSNQTIPFDKKLQQMAENTFEKQARFLYEGTKFEGNDQQKVAALSTLRRKIEQYIEKRGLQGVILDMPFKLNMTKEQESAHKVEYNQTLAEIDLIRKDYIHSGGTDPNFLISVNNMERYYKENHPLGKQELPNKLQMNLQERGQITQNPIFQFLPETFQKEILDLENKANIQREADLRNPQLNKELLRAPVDVGDSSKADEMMLENLRQQESELMLGRSSSLLNQQKFEEIQRLKQIYEKRYLEKKVQEQLAMRQIEEDVLNFKGRPQDKLNYLQYLQGEIGTMPLFYDPDAGFIVRVDFINKLPICYDYVKVSYGIFIKNIDEPKTTVTTNQHECNQENVFAKKCIIQERFVERNHEIYKDTFVYIILWGYSQDFGSGMVPIQIGWTIHKLFDDENLISGCFLIPFYNATFTFDLQRMPEVQEIKVGIRISMPGDAVLDIENRIMNVTDYKVQPLHIKSQELIDQERQFKFKEHRVFPLPKEFIHTQFNDPKLWQSELPPNVYKLMDYNFLNEEQAALKQQQMEYEERKQNRLNRPRRRFMGKQGTIARAPGDKKKTILTFRQRMAMKKGTTTPMTNKNKQEAVSRPDSKASNSRTKVEQQPRSTRGPEKEKSTLLPSKPRKLTFKLRSISQIYVGGISTLTLKLALFSGIKLLEDDDKNMCVYTKELEPDEKGDNYFNYTETYTFELNLNDYFEDEEQADILNTYIFIAIFKDTTSLFGWQALEVFESSDEHYKIKSGIYYENLFGPPGQAPPFNLNRTKRLNAQINFILMQDDDRVLQLPTFDNYKLDQKLLTEEDKEKRKKIYSVANPKWNTQIRLDISSLKNFQSKDDFIMKTIVIENDNIIIDAIDRQCIKFDNVELFEGTGKGEFIANHTIILRIGTKYLTDTFNTTYKKLNYLFSFFIKQSLVGVVQFPLFSSGGTLNLGSQKLMVHDLDESGKIGKKTIKEMYIFIQEEPLNLKDVEETPKYAQQTKEQKIVNKQDQSKFLIFDIEELTDYIGPEPVTFTIQIYNDTEPAIDQDGTMCVYTSSTETPFQPKPNLSVPIYDTVYFKLPINSIIERKQGLDNYQVFISFPNLGWLNFQLFLNGELNSKDFQAKLFRGEVPAPPVDYTNMKKLNTKISYYVRYDYKVTEDQKQSSIEGSRPQIQSGTIKQPLPSGTNVLASEQGPKMASRRTMNSIENNDKITIIFINVNGYTVQSKLKIKGILLTENKTMMDKNNQSCSFLTDLVNNVNKVAFFNNTRYSFQIDVAQLVMESYIFLSIMDENDQVIGWYGRKLVQAVGKLIRGQSFEYLYKPPLQRPPIDKSKTQNLPQSIQFEVK